MHDFDCMAADAHVNYAVIPARSPNENPAGTPDFESLLDHHTFFGLGHSMRDHPSGRAARR